MAWPCLLKAPCIIVPNRYAKEKGGNDADHRNQLQPITPGNQYRGVSRIAAHKR